MKKIIVVIIVILSLFTFNRCQKEDVYNPKKRLISIFDYTQTVKSPYVSFIYDEDETIEKAIFFDNSSFTFEYTEDQQVSKISGYANNLPYGYVMMEYLDKKLSKVSYYNNPGKLFQMDTFFRQNGTIYGYKSYITSTIGKSQLTENCDSRLFHTFMHPHSSKNIEKILTQAKCGLVQVSHTNVAYSDKNITQIETVYNNGFTTVYKFTYDKMKNPLYGLPFALVEYFSLPSSPLASYSKNNFITSSYSEHYGTPTSNETMVNYDLVYQKNDYPTHIYATVGHQTFLRWEFTYLN